MYSRNILEVYRRVIEYSKKIRQKTMINFKAIKIDHFNIRTIPKHLKKISQPSNLSHLKKLCNEVTIITVISRNHRTIDEFKRKLKSSLKLKLGNNNKDWHKICHIVTKVELKISNIKLVEYFQRQNKFQYFIIVVTTILREIVEKLHLQCIRRDSYISSSNNSSKRNKCMKNR